MQCIEMRITYERLRKIAVRPFVLGSIDGLVTSFVILASGFAGEVVKASVVTIGVASLLADAFSMGVSEYLSSRTEESVGDATIMGAMCFLSFVVFGCVPLIAYAIAPPNTETERLFSIAAFAVMLVLVSLLRANTTNANRCKSTFEVILLGTCAGAIAYGVAAAYS